MAEKDLNYRITGDSAGLEKASDRGAAALRKMEREARRLEAQQVKTRAAMTMVGRGMLLAGAAIAAGLALSVRAAIEWESAWAGVLKTVEGSPEQMAALEKEIRSLTGVLPATHAEIAAVAEAAGQLGVRREDVAAFTKTMIDMGEATDLSAEQAATALARFMNIMQTAPGDVDRLASAIVDLGNKGATTEAEITEMALRIAGAASTIGLTEQQVLGFAAALSNVGIRAEAGGTAISRVFLEIDRTVKSGGEELEVFARTAGMTVDQFKQAYERDAGAAIATFIAGLGRVQQSGGDVNATLDQLGLTEIRVSDALRRLASSGTNLADSLQISNTAWEENTALAAEAERRYETTAARLSIARNQVNDFAISLGSSLLPVLGEGADRLGALAQIVGDLPGPLKAALGVVAGLTAALLLAAGAALIAVPRFVAFKQALDQIAASSARAAAAVGLFGRIAGVALGPLGIAFTVAAVAVGIFANRQAEAKQRVEEVSETLNQQTGAITENTRTWVAHELEQRGVLAAAERLGIDLATLTDAILGEGAALGEVNTAVAEHNEELGSITPKVEAYAAALKAQGIDQLEVARRTAEYRQQLEEQDRAADSVRGTVNGLTGDVQAAADATRRQAEASGEATSEMEQLDPATRNLAEGMGITAGEAEELSGAVGELRKELDALLGFLFDVEEAQDSAVEAMRRATEHARENGNAWRGNSEAALQNRDNLRSWIKADTDVIAAMAETGATSDELTGATERLRRKFVDQMRQAGFSEEAIDHYAAAYDQIPSSVRTTIGTPGIEAAIGRAEALRNVLDNIDRFVEINIAVNGPQPGVGGLRGAFQHGGRIPGPASAPVDSEIIAATPGEFVVRREVSVPNMAALEAFNRTGRWPVTGGAGALSTAAAARTSTTGQLDQRDLARLVAREVGHALDGARLVVDSRGMGRLEARQADIYRRGG